MSDDIVFERPSYRQLPRITGWSYLVSVALGRLPLAMVPLAVLTLAASATGSLRIAGFAAAAAAFAEAIGSPLAGLLADRVGQRPVLLTSVALHIASLVAFALAAGSATDGVTVLLAGIAGLSIPQVGALSRARWLAMAPKNASIAFAFEGVLDEVSYIFGPALVGLIAVAASPRAAICFACGLIAIFATMFAVHRTHRMVPRRRDLRPTAQEAPSDASSVRRRRLMLIALSLAGTFSMGFFFGGSQTGLTAFAQRADIPDAGALLYASMAVGSAVTTMSMVLVPARVGLWTRWLIAATGLTLGAVLMLTATSVPLVVVFATLAGAFQGPLLLTIFSVAGSVAGLGEGGFIMTFVGSGVVVGIGVSSAIGGALSEAFGPAGGFGVVLTASLLLFALGATAAITSRRRRTFDDS
ncbi:MAG: MFS transporter [Microbacterium sp.]